MLSWEIILKIASSVVEMCVNLGFSFVIYRMPIKPVFKRILIASMIISIISILQRELPAIEPYAFITQIICYILFIAVIYNLPILYSVLIGLTGYTSFVILQLSLLFILQLFGVSFYDVSSSIVYYIAFQLVESVIGFAIIYYLSIRKIGFLFIVKRLTIKQRMTKANFIISMLFGAALILMQIIFIFIRMHTFYLNIVLVLAVLFPITVFMIYKKNNVEIRRKYGKRSNIS